MQCVKYLLKESVWRTNRSCLRQCLKSLSVRQVNLCSSQQQQTAAEPVPSLEDKPLFPGSRSKWTQTLQFIQPDTYDGIPVYRVMNRDGKVINPGHDPNLGKETITKIYKGNLNANEGC